MTKTVVKTKYQIEKENRERAIYDDFNELMKQPGAMATAVTDHLMKKYNLAIWAHHGMFASGEDFDLSFGLMHTAENSAEILVKMLSMQPNKRQTITPDNFRDLAKAFNVILPEEFLYEK